MPFNNETKTKHNLRINVINIVQSHFKYHLKQIYLIPRWNHDRYNHLWSESSGGNDNELVASHTSKLPNWSLTKLMLFIIITRMLLFVREFHTLPQWMQSAYSMPRQQGNTRCVAQKLW